MGLSKQCYFSCLLQGNLYSFRALKLPKTFMNLLNCGQRENLLLRSTFSLSQALYQGFVYNSSRTCLLAALTKLRVSRVAKGSLSSRLYCYLCLYHLHLYLYNNGNEGRFSHLIAQWEEVWACFTVSSSHLTLDQKAKRTGCTMAKPRDTWAGIASSWSNLEDYSAPEGRSLLPAAMPLDTPSNISLNPRGNRADEQKPLWKLSLKGLP